MTRARLREPLELTVEADIPNHLPLNADRAFVGMIAQNLLENAVKYNAPGGRVRVAAQAVNGSVEIIVGNTGPAISQGPGAARLRTLLPGARRRAGRRQRARPEHVARARSRPRRRDHARAFRCGVDGIASALPGRLRLTTEGRRRAQRAGSFGARRRRASTARTAVCAERTGGDLSRVKLSRRPPRCSVQA